MWSASPPFDRNKRCQGGKGDADDNDNTPTEPVKQNLHFLVCTHIEGKLLASKSQLLHYISNESGQDLFYCSC